MTSSETDNLLPDLAQALTRAAPNGRLSCRNTHRLAVALGRRPLQVGQVMDCQKIRITECQMGLFGHAGPGNGPDGETPPDPALEKALAPWVNADCISCARCWQIAASLNCARMTVGSACNRLGIKIRPCQLGAF